MEEWEVPNLGRDLRRHYGRIVHCRHEAERRKTVKYQRLMDHYHFSPLGFETFGSWGESAKALVTEIARRIQAQTGEARSAEFLRQRISIELQRGNAASVLGTVDTPKSCDEFFFLLGFNNF